jgi:homoserine dehydrogenase
VESLIPKPLESSKSGDEFLARLGEFDDDIEKVKKEAEAEGKVIRYVGSINVTKKVLKVGLQK